MAESAAAYLGAAEPSAAAAPGAATAAPAGLLAGVPDWSTVLPTVKQQGMCGSCWAFAVTALVEAGHFIKTGEVLPLSEKQLLDCDESNGGCDGGFFDTAFDYLIDAGGQCTAADLPYVPVKGACPATLPPRASKVASYKAGPRNNEAAMLAALQNGPLAVAITADSAMFEYAGGVFSSTTCGGPVNHAVVVVGAGVDDATGTPYWLIRNSWGRWGEGGYMRIQRGVGGAGMCNIALYPFTALSADPQPKPPPPAPAAGCKNRTVTVDASTNLNKLARAGGLSVAQIMIDNGLRGAFDKGVSGKFQPGTDVEPQIPLGTKLTLRCPAGTWSAPLGSWNNAIWYQGMMAAPVVGYCPPGHYVVEISSRPSTITVWDNLGAVRWIGQVTMTCSDGTKLTADAMPNATTLLPAGTQTQMNGFSNVTYKSGFAVDSLLGVGDVGGEPGTFACPPDTLLTGFSTGTGVAQYSKGVGIIDSLQFFCSNPYGTNQTAVQSVRKLRAGQFPRIKAGLSCKAVNTTSGDTWLTIAARFSTSSYPIEFYDVIRANPALGGAAIPRGSKVFIPPCVNGVLQSALVPKPGAQAQSSEPASLALAVGEVVFLDSSTPAGQAAVQATFSGGAPPLAEDGQARGAVEATHATEVAAAAALAPEEPVPKLPSTAEAVGGQQPSPTNHVDATAPAEALPVDPRGSLTA